MGLAHHSVYPVWLELARCEMLRAQGQPYSVLEPAGVCFVVARMSLRFRRPARYDELIRVSVRPAPESGAPRRRIKLDHLYDITRGDDLLATAATTLVCTNPDGTPRAVPDDVLPTPTHTGPHHPD